MSVEPATKISDPAQLEHRLVTMMRDFAVHGAKDETIVAACAASESCKPGLVLSDDAEAAMLTDIVHTLTLGERRIKFTEDTLLRIPNQMKLAVAGITHPLRERFKLAKDRANAAQVAWAGEKRRRAAAETLRLEREAAAQARAQAEEAALLGADIPPPPELAPVVAAKQVRGGAGMTTMQVRTQAREIAAWAEVDPALVMVNGSVALSAFAAAVSRGDVKKPGPGESVVWSGIRFEGVESAVNR